MSGVVIIGVVGAVLASALHVAFFWLESLRFRRPSTWRAFGLTSQDHADVVAPMAFNQGCYNLFLAIGTLTGVVVLLSGEKTIGWTLMLFGCSTMVGAALVLATSTSGMLRAALLQGVPPLLCIATAIVNFS